MIARINDLSIEELSSNAELTDIVNQLSAMKERFSKETPSFSTFLEPIIKEFKVLTTLSDDIVKKAAKIQEVEKKIKEEEKKFQQVLTSYQTKSQVVFSVLGKAAGSAPPFPTVDADTLPMTLAIETAKKTLDTLNTTLAQLRGENGQSIVRLSSIKDRLIGVVNDKIISNFGVSIDVDKEQFILM